MMIRMHYHTVSRELKMTGARRLKSEKRTPDEAKHQRRVGGSRKKVFRFDHRERARRVRRILGSEVEITN